MRLLATWKTTACKGRRWDIRPTPVLCVEVVSATRRPAPSFSPPVPTPRSATYAACLRRIARARNHGPQTQGVLTLLAEAERAHVAARERRDSTSSGRVVV